MLSATMSLLRNCVPKVWLQNSEYMRNLQKNRINKTNLNLTDVTQQHRKVNQCWLQHIIAFVTMTTCRVNIMSSRVFGCCVIL